MSMSETELNDLKVFVAAEIKGINKQVEELFKLMSRVERHIDVIIDKSEKNGQDIVRLESEQKTLSKDLANNFKQHEQFYDRIGELEKDTHKDLHDCMGEIEKRVDVLEKVDALRKGQLSVLHWIAPAGGAAGLLALIGLIIKTISEYISK